MRRWQFVVHKQIYDLYCEIANMAFIAWQRSGYANTVAHDNWLSARAKAMTILHNQERT